ncbi:MAG: NYN domain-containing protein [Candidatus Omnitrophica bacterium]|nr:NYN domain-containing protein [Candidatus Omnitrophota bacterium]MBU4477679.1 NYN domain-containing protein [Candidatus Omnitrophota bacterium]MCG2703876.1 NYN domain-containing protein [Candidatus Omnitrophota bacterium]
MNKVAFLIDGFNIYHSIRDLERYTGYRTKWLDIASLCKSYIYLFGKDAQFHSVYYFSAIPYYLASQAPNKITRHKQYIKCLQSSGIHIELGRFKEKFVFCDKCRSMVLKHEEKETDVTIAIKVVELFLKNDCDTCVIVSGDTDLSPAARKCKAIFPHKNIVFAFPFNRKNKELLKIAPNSFSISKKQYIKHQFANPITLENGQQIYKPSLW